MNAGCYKTVYSKRVGALVAVGEHAVGQGKTASGARAAAGAMSGAASAGAYVGAVLASLALTSAAWAQLSSQALPTGAQLAQGAATVQSAAGQMQIRQSSDKAVLNWQSFNVGASSLVKIDQPTAQSVLLNRVVGGDASQILGRVQANGQVVLVNPNGIVFGKDGSVSASSFTASTLGISDADFMAGRLRFQRESSTGSISNEGRLEAAPGGYVALLGSTVTNAGTIATQGGAVGLAAAEQVSIALSGSGKIRMELSPSAVQAAVANAKDGVIVTEGGQVFLRAESLNQTVASLLQAGRIDSSAAQGGEVSLLSDQGQIRVSGSIVADSAATGSKGGDIIIGRDPKTGVLARSTDVSGAQLQSREGFIETSGDWLKTDAVKVVAGEWLLDPADIVIGNFSGSNSNIGTTVAAPTSTYTPSTGAAASQIDVGVINTALASGNVVITTTNSGTAGAGNGDITLNAGTAINYGSGGSASKGNLTLTADRDIVLNADVTTYSSSFTAKRDIHVNENITGGSGTNLYAGRDVYLMKNFSGGTTSNVYAAYKGGTPGNGWQNGTGRILLDPAAVLSYSYAMTLASGLGYTSSGSVDTSNGTRSNFSDSQLNWNNSANAGSNVKLYGFSDVTLSNSRAGGVGIVVPSGTVNVAAKNITVGANITTADLTLNAGMFETTAGSTLGNYTNSNWANKIGSLDLGSKTLTYTGLLDLRSGLVDSTGVRKSVSGSNVAWSSTSVGSLLMDGFDTVTLASDVKGGAVEVFANQINLQGNLTSVGAVKLIAASFDPLGSTLGGLAGTTGNASGWQNLKGELSITAGKTITGTAFDLRNGVNSSNTLLRQDLDASVKLVGTGNVASSVYLVGFRDVKLPNLTDVTNAGSYTVLARNIDATGVPGAKLNAFTLRLWSGIYQDLAGVNKYSFNTVGRNGQGFGGDNNNVGTLSLPANLILQSSVLDLTSGITGVSGSQRVSLSPQSLGPYVDPSNPTRYTGAYYTTSGGVNTLRQGGARYVNLHGFNTVTLPATPLNYEMVDIGASNVVINADINAGQGSWWPFPFYLYIQAGTYNPTTGVSGGTNAGSVSFNNNPVIRVQGYTPAGFYGTASSPLGFNSYLQIVNGSTAADFTARLGYTNADYSAGGSGVFTGLTLQNFSNTRLEMENVADKITVKDSSGTGSINISQASAATGAISIRNDLSAENTITLNAGNGSIRMGSQVAKAATVSLTTGANSAANIDADTLNVTSKNLGSTLVVNEANNVTLSNSGASSDTGNIEINARGELSLGANFTRTGGSNTASLTLRADAQYGNTVDPSTGNWVGQTLNTVFNSYNNGTTGELGGDGSGAIRVSSAQPTLVLPVFKQVAVVDAAAGFTTPAGNTTYFKPDGTLYASSTLLPQGTLIVLGSGTNPTAAMDLVTASGSPYRIKSTVTQGGWTVTSANTFYNSAGTAYANGAVLSVGTEVYYKVSTSAPTGNISNSYLNGGNNGQVLLYVVGGYTSSNATNTVADYVSKGLSYTAGYSYGGVTASLASSATVLSGDTPVDTSVAGNYYGNPVSGSNSRLHMSGQFYAMNPGSIYGTTGYLNGAQAAPTQVNQLATGSGNNSSSGNGWDISWGTATITTAGGALKLFSGPKHALAGPGYGVGDPADLNIFTNPVTSDFVNTKPIKDSAFALTAGSGDLVALGFRDVYLDPTGTLSSSGNVTIGAARDMVLNNNSNLGGSGTLTTLLAGGMISNRVNGVYNTLGPSTGAGTSNLMAVAGGGVDLKTNMATVTGSLQDNPLMTGVLAGGMTPTGSFNIIGSSKQTAGLVVGGSFTNAQVNDVTFDGTAGILYSADQPLKREGISSKPKASGTGSVTGNYGAVNLSTAGNTGMSGDIKIQGAIDTHLTGGHVVATAQRHVLQAADINAGTGDATLAATEVGVGAISRTGGTITAEHVVMTASTTIGSSSQTMRTDAGTLAMASGGNQFVNEANDVVLAATTDLNGAVVVGAAGVLTVGSASGLSGVNTGSGEINLKGQGVALNANATTTGQAFVEAIGNITDNGNGLLSADSAVLTAGGLMGASNQRVLTHVNRLAVNANGGSGSTAYIKEIDALTLTAKAPNGGNVDLQNLTGTLTLGRFNLDPVVTLSNAVGYAAPSDAARGIDSTGGVSLKAVAGQVDVAQNLVAAGTVNLVGRTADGSTAVQLRSGRSISNNASAGESTTLQAEQGNISADGLSTVVGAAGAGVIQLLAGSTAGAAGAIDGSLIQITQNGGGTAQGNNGTVGVRVQSSGSGDVIAPKITNNGSGHVVLSAGSALAAGNAGGGQVKTASGNSTSQQGGGKTYVYTGAAASSGDLELIDSSFSTLYLSQVGGNPANAKTYTDYASGPQQNSGGNSQVMVREQLSFTDKIDSASLRITYGDSDPTATQVKDALKAANQSGGSSIVETVVAGSNAYQVTRAALIDDLTVTQPAPNGSPRQVIRDTGGAVDAYRYTLSGNNFVVLDSTPESPTARLYVDPRAASISAVAKRVGYNGETQSQDQYTSSGFLAGESFIVTGLASARNAGTYGSHIQADGAGLGNYSISYTDADLVIDKAVLTLRAVTDSKVYDGKLSSSQAPLVSGLQSGDQVTQLTQSFTDKNAGTGKELRVNAGYVLADGNGGGNYIVNTESVFTGEITKAQAVVTANSANTVYNGQTQSVTGFTASGLVAGETESVLSGLSSVGGQGKNAGSYSHRISGSDGNYALTFVDGALTIAKAQAVVTANSASTVYNGQTQSVTGFTASGLVAGETESVLSGLSSVGGQGKNAGSYTHRISGSDGNYALTFVDGALNIAKAQAVVTANSANTVYNGQTQSVTGFTASGLVAGETESVLSGLSSVGGQGKNAGSYTHRISGSDGNYALTFVDGALNIDKAQAVVTANSANTVYNGQTQSVTGFTASGLVAGETEAVLGGLSSVGGQGKNAGSYTHRISGSDGNYALTFVDGALTIAKAQAVVTANSASTVYNGQTQSVTGFTASGLVAGETEVVLSGLSSTGGQGRNAGRYVHQVSGADGNYALTFVDGALTVNKAQASVSGVGSSTIYNGLVQTQADAVTRGFVAGDDVVIQGPASGRNAGTYDSALQVSGRDAGNYNITVSNASLRIDPKAVQVTGITAADKVYDGSTAASIGFGAVSGTVLGETLFVSGVGAFDDKNAGQGKTVTVADATALTRSNGTGDWLNYRLVSTGPVSTQAAITPKLLTVVGTTVADKVFDGNTRALASAGTLQGLVGLETLVFASLSAQFQDAAVGTGKPVSVSYGLGDGLNGGLATNYRVAGTNHSATITAGSRRPDDPKPIPPNDRDPSRIIDVRPTGAGVPNLCNEEHLDDADTTQIGLTEDKIKQCSCDLTEVNGVYLCYTPRAEESAKKEKRS